MILGEVLKAASRAIVIPGAIGLLLLSLISTARAQATDRAFKITANTTEIPFKSHDGYDMFGYFTKGTLPEGHKAIFEFIANQTRKKS